MIINISYTVSTSGCDFAQEGIVGLSLAGVDKPVRLTIVPDLSK